MRLGGTQGQQRPLRGADDLCFRDISAHLPNHYKLGASVLKSAQVYITGYDPGPAGQRQVSEARSLLLGCLSWMQLVELPIVRTALPMR